MPTVLHQGIRTHYLVDGAGPPALLIHGFSGNHTTWIDEGFVAPLRTQFQLILPDLRAHGQSDGPVDPEAYALPTMAADMLAILNSLGIAHAHVLGYSLGGVVAYTLARDAPARVASLAVGGMSPYDPEPRGAPSALSRLYDRAAHEGVEVLVEGIRSWFGAISPAYEARLRSANLAGGAALLRWRHTHLEDFAADLPRMTMPALLYCGEHDDELADMQRAAMALPRARFVPLPGLNHVQAAGASTELVPLLRDFWHSSAEVAYSGAGRVYIP